MEGIGLSPRNLKTAARRHGRLTSGKDVQLLAPTGCGLLAKAGVADAPAVRSAQGHLRLSKTASPKAEQSKRPTQCCPGPRESQSHSNPLDTPPHTPLHALTSYPQFISPLHTSLQTPLHTLTSQPHLMPQLRPSIKTPLYTPNSQPHLTPPLHTHHTLPAHAHGPFFVSSFSWVCVENAYCETLISPSACTTRHDQP